MRVQARDGTLLGYFAGDWQPGRRYFFQSGSKLIELECAVVPIVTARRMTVLRPLLRSHVKTEDVRRVAGFRP